MIYPRCFKGRVVTDIPYTFGHGVLAMAGSPQLRGNAGLVSDAGVQRSRELQKFFLSFAKNIEEGSGNRSAEPTAGGE